MRISRIGLGCAVAAFLSLYGVAAAAVPAAQAGTAASPAAPNLNHVFLIMEENNGFGDIIGNLPLVEHR